MQALITLAVVILIWIGMLVLIAKTYRNNREQYQKPGGFFNLMADLGRKFMFK